MNVLEWKSPPPFWNAVFTPENPFEQTPTERMNTKMNRTKRIQWLAFLLVPFVLAGTGRGAMIGIGREGDYVLEMFAERSDVVREAGTATVTLPREAEELFLAADIQKGDPVWSGDKVRGKASASVVVLVPAWRSCTLKLAETLHPEPVPVERFHLLRWEDLGKRFTERLNSLGRTNEAVFRAGMAEVLGQVRTVFGGQSMVVGFPGTKYEAEYRNVKRAFDRNARRGLMRGFAADRSLRSDYRSVFGEEWPTALLGIFLAGDGHPLEIRRIADAEGHPLPDVFAASFPIRLEGTKRVGGVFPADKTVRITYAPAGEEGGGAEAERTFQATVASGCPVWFILQASSGAAETVRAVPLENAGSVAVSVKVTLGEDVRTCSLPAGEEALLYLVTRPDVPIRLGGEADASDPFAQDWVVPLPQEVEGKYRFVSTRKAAPGLVLNNPEMMPVDVTVAPVGGGWGSATKLTLRAGETGVGIPVPAHKPLTLSYRFRSDFHKAGQQEIPALFYGDRSNLVLRAELKGDPEVTVLNAGSVAVRISGMASPAGEVEIQPGKTAKVTVPAGKRSLLQGTPTKADYQCDPIPVSAMDPGDTTTVKIRTSLKPAPQVVLRNERGMMDAEVTPMAASGHPLGKPFTVKRGASTRPMPLPSGPSSYYHLTYSNGRFTAQGRLDIPAVPRGEIRTLDIPNPTEGIRLQTPGMPASAASAKPAPLSSSRAPVSAPASAPAPAKPASRPAPSSASAPVLLSP